MNNSISINDYPGDYFDENKTKDLKVRSKSGINMPSSIKTPVKSYDNGEHLNSIKPRGDGFESIHSNMLGV